MKAIICDYCGKVLKRGEIFHKIKTYGTGIPNSIKKDMPLLKDYYLEFDCSEELNKDLCPRCYAMFLRNLESVKSDTFVESHSDY